MDKLQTVDIDTVSAVLGVSDKTIRTWISDCGLPSTKDGRTRTFHFPDVLAWYVGFESSRKNGVAADFAPDEEQEPDDQRRANLRKTRAEANIKELQLSKLRKEVVAIEEIAPKLNRMFGNLRSNLLSMPRKLADIAAGERDPNKLETRYKDVLEDLCREISTGTIIGKEEGEESPETDENQPGSLEEVAAAADIDEIQARLTEGLDHAYSRL